MDYSVVIYDNYLRDNRTTVRLLMILTLVYYVIAVVFPVIFTIFDDLMNSCSGGLSWISYFIYIAFAASTFLLELFLYSRVLKLVDHLVPGLKLSVSTSYLAKITNSINTKIMNIQSFNYKMLLYLGAIIKSQLARYDLFTDIGFIVNCF
jgi:hypothetical protein